MSIENINHLNNIQKVTAEPSTDANDQNSSEQLEANQNQFSALDSKTQKMRDGLLDYANNMLTENDRAAQRMNGNTDIVEHKFHFGEEDDGRGSRNGFDETPLGNNDSPPVSSPFIQAAKALLKQILGLIKVGGGDVNPNVMIAQYSQGSKIAQLAKTLAEAGMTEDVVEGNSMLKHEALDVDSKASGVKGEFDTQIQYWKDVLKGNEQAEKDTHDHAKHG